MQDWDKKQNLSNNDISDRYSFDLKEFWTRTLELVENIMLVVTVPGDSQESKEETKREILSGFRKKILRIGNDKIRSFTKDFIKDYKINKIGLRVKDVIEFNGNKVEKDKEYDNI